MLKRMIKVRPKLPSIEESKNENKTTIEVDMNESLNRYTSSQILEKDESVNETEMRLCDTQLS